MTNGSGVEVTAWVKISDGATIDYHVCGDEEVEFSIGGRHGFDLLTTERGLRSLIDRAQEALRAVQSAVARDDEACPTA